MATARLAFSFVLYTSRCVSGRGSDDDAWCENKRLGFYGDSFCINAAALGTLFPHTTVLLHVWDVDVARHDKLCRWLERTAASHPNVRVVQFSHDAVGGAAVAARMSLGQQLRCARYLPLFGCDGTYDAVVVRDADSIVSARDAALITQWMASPNDVQWLLVREHAMAVTLACGGGIAARLPLHFPGTLGAAMAALPATSDETFWEPLLPRALHAMDSSAPVQLRDDVMLVTTRVARGGHYFVWDAAARRGELLWRTGVAVCDFWDDAVPDVLLGDNDAVWIR